MDKTLVVDLDGTLIRSDMLYESFWSAFGQNWRSPFRAISALMNGRAALKQFLADCATVDVSTLPYDQGVLDYIGQWREAGGSVALVTASDQAYADGIAAHLGVFDAAHGSDGTVNLKGTQKADFLDRTFGTGNYLYAGDSSADLPIWSRCQKAITVNAAPDLRKQAEDAAPEVEHLDTGRSSPRDYLRALRPHQWLKNVLVFLPMLAAHQFDGSTLVLSLLAFLSFSAVASSVYVVNDLLDLAADRAHPRKRKRPFASGAIPIAAGTWMAAGLLGAGVLLALIVGPAFLWIMVLYYALTTGYSLYLKRQITIDICVLAGLYTIRIVAGGVATGIPLSVWLLAFAIFFFLSLAAVKRQAELVDSAARGELSASGRGYHVDDLPIISVIAISAGYVAVLVMALYVNSPNIVELYRWPEALWGVCVVLLFWISRTVMIAHRGLMHDDPVVFAAKDRISLACFVVIVTFIVGGTIQ